VPTVFENGITFEVSQGMKAFPRMGAARGTLADSGHASGALRSAVASGRGVVRIQRFKEAGSRIVRKRGALRAQRRKGRAQIDGIGSDSVVWIFATARTGSTWLGAMMDEMEGQSVWREPLVGALFGDLYYKRAKHLIDRKGKHFILGDSYRDSWLNSIRTFILNEATVRFPEAAGPDNYLVVKEPNGSIGAPLLVAAMPESRMILLVRDPRDVVASSMDARRKGGWQYNNRNKGNQERETLSDTSPNAFVRMRASSYLQHISKAKEAYEAHKGRKVLVRYEDLRANTLAEMKRLYAALEISVDEKKLAKAVHKHAWENIPQEKKGEGKFYRKASPGGWREDLTPTQVRIVERITAPLLKEFYPERTL